MVDSTLLAGQLIHPSDQQAGVVNRGRRIFSAE